MLDRAYPTQNCSIARALEVVGERWTLLILRDAVLGVTRFEDFRAGLGIASNVLAARLDRLCEEGLLERDVDPGRPRRPRYLLTDKGREIAPALIVLLKWGDHHYPAPGGPPRRTFHRGCGGTVDAVLRCERCRRKVSYGDLELEGASSPGSPRRGSARPTRPRSAAAGTTP